MDDLISRQAAIDAIDAACMKYDISPYFDDKRTDEEKRIDWWEMGKVLVKALICDLPSAQPEPQIIRCKNCKYQEKYFHEDRRRKDGGYYIYGCELAEEYSHVCLDNDFCSRAERRTDE